MRSDHRLGGSDLRVLGEASTGGTLLAIILSWTAARRRTVTRSGSVAAAVVVVAGLALVDDGEHLAADRLTTAFDVVTVGMFLAAGILRTTRWRVHGDRADALVGSALVVLGLGLLPLLDLGTRSSGADLGAADPAGPVLVTALVTALVVGILARALVLPAHARPQPVKVVAAAGVVITCGFVALAALGARLEAAAAFGDLGTAVVHVATASAWIGVAVLAVRRRRRCPWAGRATLPLAGMGVASVVHALATTVPGSADGLAVTAAFLTAAVASVAAHQAIVDLEITVGADQEALETELQAATAAVAERDAWREELGHDATNALAGLRSALATLERYAGDLDAATITRLQHAAMAEVGHVEHLLQRRDAEPMVAMDVRRTVLDVVATRRTTSSRIQLARLDGAARGRPGDLSTVLHNLLINVARHAPGARAILDVDERPGRVEIHVVDDGPGMPDELAARIFGRGVHGGHHLSTGLGLYISRQLMREQGGDLELRGHSAGCHFVVTLATADRPAVPAAPTASGPLRQAVDVHQLLGTLR